jgi:hypothetical protein
MSHIPNSAMPHAGSSQGEEEGGTATLSERAGKLADLARDNPKTAMAAGAAVAAGVIAAAAIPLVRGRKSSGGKSGGGKKSGSKKSSA